MSDDLLKRVDSLMVLLNMERKKSLSLGKHIEKLEAGEIEFDRIIGDYASENARFRDRIEKLETALREIGRTFLAEVKSKPEQWTSKQSLLLSHEQAVEVHEELGRRILIARKALEGKSDVYFGM